MWSDQFVVKCGLSLSNKELVILNSQNLGFLICEIELILSSFSHTEAKKKKKKKNDLQRTARNLTREASVVSVPRQCLQTGHLPEDSVFCGLLGSTEQGGLQLTF